MVVGLLDYGAGNLHSVQTALEDLKAPVRLVRDETGLDGLDALVLPGVGACVDCVRNLKDKGLWEPLRDWLQADRPYFGICLGYQILFDHSDEFEGVEGLGFLKGRVVRFPINELKVPHMGWSAIRPVDRADPLWAGLPEDPYVYFVHSYYPAPEDPGIVSSTASYGLDFAASVRKGNVVATQFHPEKSQALGLKILRNFIESLRRSGSGLGFC
ncbi:MAG: imidazole glycerol phosphate synthase subunit HisH [Verrucomicrobiota bacterium]